jgi:hypothetical protein
MDFTSTLMDRFASTWKPTLDPRRLDRCSFGIKTSRPICWVGAAEQAVRKITPLFPLSHIEAVDPFGLSDAPVALVAARLEAQGRNLHFSEPIGPSWGALRRESTLEIFVYRGLKSLPTLS